MRVPVKLLGFGFWLFFLNCAQCQECLREDIKYESTEPVEKASYADGEIVKVNCMTGYSGFYKLKCEKGEWKKNIERPCAKKKCSHPGDTQNGDFKLTEGTEFVFGATVVYTCKKGYEMASRINQRTCRAQGWDNAVPVCEAVKCPAIHTDGEVTASGNTEEGSYGDVIHFECVSSDKMIDGSSDIHCEETGQWSDVAPKCKEITCAAPVIPNGYVVEPQPEYQKDDTLKYKCNEGFKSREGIPKCAKFGWTLKPECDVVTCELKSTRFGVKKINPDGTTIFRAGESVEITCSEKHWFFGTKVTSKSFTCQDNGQWDYEPVCAEITCEHPRDQHLYYANYYFSGDKKLGAIKSYRCDSGYRKMAEEATCTRDGWTPKPLCAEMCAAPNIPNADILRGRRQKYEIYSRIDYKCHPGFEPEEPFQIACDSEGQWTNIRQCSKESCPDLSVENGFTHSQSSNKEEIFYSCITGYKPFTGNWWDSVTCSKGSWSDEPRCIRKEECGALPSVHRGKLTLRDPGTADVECDPGFISTERFIKCTNGRWEKPECKEVRCDIPLEVENAVIISKPKELYLHGSTVTYVCRSSYLIRGRSTVFCQHGTWQKPPTCQEATCLLQRITTEDLNIKGHPDIEGLVKPGQTIFFSCTRQDLILKGQREITCQSNGEWSSPFPKCEETKCVAKLSSNMRSDEHPGSEVSIKPGQTITLSCVRSGSTLQGQNKITCQSNGEWSSSFPKCTGQKCGPPPDVNDADTKEMKKDEYNTGEKVEYSCFNKYTLDLSQSFSRYLTCRQGEWSGNVRCLKPCTVTKDEMDKRGIYLAYAADEKMFAPHNDHITFVCQWGNVLGGVPLRQKCNDGVMTLPECA